jgi:hypothetical protein
MSSNPESEPTLNDTVTAAAVVWTTKIRCKAMKIAPNTNAPFMTLTAAKTGQMMVYPIKTVQSTPSSGQVRQPLLQREQKTRRRKRPTAQRPPPPSLPLSHPSTLVPREIKDGGGVGMAAKMEALLPDAEVIHENDALPATINMLPILERHCSNLEEPVHVFADAIVMDDRNFNVGSTDSLVSSQSSP